MSAAIHAKREDPDAEVTIYEHGDALGRKLLITGNGKCNLTNAGISPECYHSRTDNGIISHILSRFGTGKLLDFFDGLGADLKERKGCYYPRTDTASTIRNCLVLTIKEMGIGIRLECGRISLEELRSDHDALILCMGGKTSPKTGSDGSGYALLQSLGLSMVPLFPALTPIETEEDLSALKGVRCEAGLSLLVDGEIRAVSKGELQPFDRGLSGILAMDISGEAARQKSAGKNVQVLCDFAPFYPEEEFRAAIAKKQKQNPARGIHDVLSGMLHRKLVHYLLHDLDSREPDFMEKLTDTIKRHPFTVSGRMIQDYSRAQTVSGGLDLREVTKELEIKKLPGVYVCGELLDCDGICGGYNLHWAFATGAIAGKASASRRKGEG